MPVCPVQLFPVTQITFLLARWQIRSTCRGAACLREASPRQPRGQCPARCPDAVAQDVFGCLGVPLTSWETTQGRPGRAGARSSTAARLCASTRLGRSYWLAVEHHQQRARSASTPGPQSSASGYRPGDQEAQRAVRTRRGGKSKGLNTQARDEVDSAHLEFLVCNGKLQYQLRSVGRSGVSCCWPRPRHMNLPGGGFARLLLHVLSFFGSGILGGALFFVQLALLAARPILRHKICLIINL